MADEMQVTLPEGVLKPIIQAQVVAALQGQGRLIEEMVAFVLKQKVRDQKSYQDIPFVESVARTLISEAVEAAVREWVVSYRPEIQKQVDRQMRAQVRGIAAQLVAAVAAGAASKWQLRVDVKLGGD